MRRTRRIGLSVLTALLGGTMTCAQSPSAGTRLIAFDSARTVCIPAKTPMFDMNTLAETAFLGGQADAPAISLDQEWVQIQEGDAAYLVAANTLRFGAC